MPGPKPLPLERIWQRGVRDGECLIWTGATVRGYGAIQRSGTVMYVHRVAWELVNGPIPEGAVILHRCDRPACFEPTHLTVGSQAANLQDAASKVRMSWGEGRSNRKVSLAQVREIRRLAAEGATSDALAGRFPINARTIRKIVAGKNWRHDS